jgi:2-oxoglutarate dehydrogenase E2 component (dihydrolipoamide succinyltransferase)
VLPQLLQKKKHLPKKKEAPETKPAPEKKPETTQAKPAPEKTPEAKPAPTKPKEETKAPPPAKETPAKTAATPELKLGSREERRVKMTKMRQRIAARLKESQNTAAMLTTFQEVDMHNIMELRNKYKDAFEKKHGAKLGFMSAFVRASSIALRDNPVANAVIDGDHILYRDYQDISVAVATPNGLVVPVLRNVETMSFADIEKAINEYAKKAREGTLAIEDMSGGTFTISNGGVYGSLFGTPIINPPQSAILGMHAINKKPHVVGDEIKIRPIMYLALTYDHRLLDGRDAVLFLRKIKSCIEEPESMLLDI